MPNQLGSVNAWIARDAGGGATIVDTGIAPGARSSWVEAFALLDVEPTAVHTIVVTHLHPDHIGGSAALATLTGARVLASRSTIDQSAQVWGPGAEAWFGQVRSYFAAHGLAPESDEVYERDLAGALAAVGLPDRIEALEPGGSVEMGGERWQVVATPGHADGHVCLFAPGSRRLLCGDHVLERISPAIGLYPDGAPDPLADYLGSLARVAALDARLALPGHGTPFSNVVARCAALVEHHVERLDACAASLEHGASTASDVASVVFGDGHDRANRRFAVAEALAHLEHLRAAGRVTRAPDRAGVWRYALAHVEPVVAAQ